MAAPVAGPLVTGAVNRAARMSATVLHRLQATDDAAEQACAAQYGGWSQSYRQLSNGPYRGEVEDLVLGPLAIVRENGNRIVHETGALMTDAVALGLATTMDGDAYFCGSAFGAGSVATLLPGAAFEMRSAGSFEVTAVVFRPSALGRWLDSPSCAAALGPALHAMPPVCHTPHGTRLEYFLDALLDAARCHPAGLRQHAAQIQVADDFLAIATSIAGPRRVAARRLGAGRERVIRRLRDYLADPEAVHVNVAGLCTALAVDRRTLQNCVQEALGVTPHAYLKAFRLNAVRRALRNPAHAGDSIADIAARSGFWHPSQFAADYARLFGERPSATRARAFSDS